MPRELHEPTKNVKNRGVARLRPFRSAGKYEFPVLETSARAHWLLTQTDFAASRPTRLLARA